jgi:hypothetical protein
MVLVLVVIVAVVVLGISVAVVINKNRCLEEILSEIRSRRIIEHHVWNEHGWTDIHCVGLEVLSAVVMNSPIFWDITPCSRLRVNRRFGKTYCLHVVARLVWRLYKTGIGLTTGFIGSHTVTHNYSVYTLTAHYSSLQHLLSLLTVSSLAACLPIPDSARTPRLTDWLALGPNTHSSVFWRLPLQLTRLDCRFTVDSRLDNSARTPRLNYYYYYYSRSTLLYSSGRPTVGVTWCLTRARPPYCLRHVRHFVYVTLYCWLLPTASTSQY